MFAFDNLREQDGVWFPFRPARRGGRHRAAPCLRRTKTDRESRHRAALRIKLGREELARPLQQSELTDIDSVSRLLCKLQVQMLGIDC